jgi:hypothetical protein
MSSFFLAVRVEDEEASQSSRDCASDGTHDEALVSAVNLQLWLSSQSSTSTPMESLDKLVVIDADAIALYMSQQRSEIGTATTVAIFVPPALLQALSDLATEPIVSSKQDLTLDTTASTIACPYIQELHCDVIQQKALSLLHPMLEHEPCRIRALVHSKSTSPSDVILLDISNCHQGWLDAITRKLCGEPMTCSESAVLEFFALTGTVVTTKRLNATAAMESLAGPLFQIPTCAVCLHRIYPPRLGMPQPRNDQLCSEYCVSGGCHNEVYLQPWSSNACKACHMIHLNGVEDIFCNCCALQETLWICLTCGFVGCGRYSHGHAANHFTESQHAFALEIATMRIWDYASGEFAHRGDLLECPSMNRRHHPQWANVMLPWESEKKPTDTGNDPSPKKSAMIGEEYEALLQSALEDQAQHYEGEISRLHAQFTAEQIDKNSMTEEEKVEIDKLKSDIQHLRDDLTILSRNLLDMQAQEAGHRAASQRLLREQGIAKDLLDKIREETEKEHEQGKMLVEDLEQQVADLTANLRMRHQISQDQELSQAHIYGTVTPNSKQHNAKRGNKKSRRSNRN